jgi:hypothetical protein
MLWVDGGKISSRSWVKKGEGQLADVFNFLEFNFWLIRSVKLRNTSSSLESFAVVAVAFCVFSLSVGFDGIDLFVEFTVTVLFLAFGFCVFVIVSSTSMISTKTRQIRHVKFHELVV